MDELCFKRLQIKGLFSDAMIDARIRSEVGIPVPIWILFCEIGSGLGLGLGLGFRVRI
jgi:hypothetical protein